jgi:phage FluMu protein Com
MAIKLVTTKTNCASCKKLVTGKLQKQGKELKVTCPRCERLLWTHDGEKWRWS